MNKLPKEATEDEVRALFSTVGDVEDVRIIMDLTPDQKEDARVNNKGFCYVQFLYKESVINAVKHLDGKPFYPNEQPEDSSTLLSV